MLHSNEPTRAKAQQLPQPSWSLMGVQKFCPSISRQSKALGSRPRGWHGSKGAPVRQSSGTITPHSSARLRWVAALSFTVNVQPSSSPRLRKPSRSSDESWATAGIAPIHAVAMTAAAISGHSRHPSLRAVFECCIVIAPFVATEPVVALPVPSGPVVDKTDFFIHYNPSLGGLQG